MTAKHDIFISYARVDDIPPPGVDKGWVSNFVDGLKSYLAKEMGRRDKFKLWMDYELRGNESVTPAIEETLAGAHTLVLFLSNGYIESEWCQRELLLFANRVGNESNRIFLVELMPIDESPKHLADLRGYKLWVDEAEAHRTLGDPAPDPTERDYYRFLKRLSADLKAVLEQVPQSESISEDLVFVNGGIEDRELIRATAEELREANIPHVSSIIAHSDFDLDSPDIAKLERDLADNLELCDRVLLVHERAPPAQIGQFIKEYHKAKAKRPDRLPSGIAVCETNAQVPDFGAHLPELLLVQMEQPCPRECTKRILEEWAG